jgi:hypothetical protein
VRSRLLRNRAVTGAVTDARVAEMTRYAPPPDTVAAAQPARILVTRPVWVRDSLLVSRWVDTAPASAPSPTRDAGAARLDYRRVAATAQTVQVAAADTAARAQRSTDFRVRHAAIDQLVDRPQVVRASPELRAVLITQLDSIGVRRLNGAALLPASANEEDREEFGEYVIALTRAVVRLENPTATRAVVLSGLGTSREVQRFVARQGAASLPILDTAFALDSEGSGAVVTTWAYTLAESPSRLSTTDSVFVYSRILQARHARPISFLTATRIAKLFELLPLVDSLAGSRSPATSGAAKLARRDLMSARDSASDDEWGRRLRLYTSYVCAGTIDDRRQDCVAMLAAASAADQAKGSGRRPVQAELDRLLAAARAGVQRGGVAPGEAAIIEGTAAGFAAAVR